MSTPDQTTDNQVIEIQSAGFAINRRRIVTGGVSGSVAAVERRGFARLPDRLEEGDVLIVTRLDRLGRNAIDVRGRLSGAGPTTVCASTVSPLTASTWARQRAV